MTTVSKRFLLAVGLAALGLSACNGDKASASKAPAIRTTPVTTVVSRLEPLRITEKTIGTVESRNDPRIAAEVAGRLLQVLVNTGDPVKKGQLLAEIDDRDTSNQLKADIAESARLEALLAQQERLLSRQSELVAQNFISKNALDDTTAQRNALKSQLEAARARSAISRTNLAKTKIIAPYDGAIDQKLVSTGDYVRVGDPLFRLVSNEGLDVRLPFPETVGAAIRPGQTIEITSPLVPGKNFTAVVREILPRLTETSRSVDIIAHVDATSQLRPGASVDATVIVGEVAQAVTVPEQAVILRPAGKVVYRIENNKAVQQVVATGSKTSGQIEIVSGLKGGETVALDGAGFLTDGTAVTIKNPESGNNAKQ